MKLIDDLTLDDLLIMKATMPKPRKVCLIGSTRDYEHFARVRYLETKAGRIVSTLGSDTASDEMLEVTQEEALQYMLVYLWKVEDADEVYVLNVRGRIGPATRRELEYARRIGKRIRYLEVPNPYHVENVLVTAAETVMNCERCHRVEKLLYIANKNDDSDYFFNCATCATYACRPGTVYEVREP